MKQLIIILACIITGQIGLQAQSGWTIGDRAAIGHSWTIGNKEKGDNYKFHPSFELGRKALFHFNSRAAIGFGTYFSSTGASILPENSKTKMVMRSNFIRVPVFASFNLGDPSNRVRPHFTIGPSVGFLVGGKTFAKFDNDSFIGAYTTKAMNTKIDAGAEVSVGFNIRVSDGFWINHDINYYHGLVEQKPNNLAQGPSFTHRNLSLSMGMQISSEAMKKWHGKMRTHHSK